MSDILRLVTFTSAARPVIVRDLENGSTFQKVRDSFQIAAPVKKQQMAAANRRYGGARQTGELHDNAVISWQAQVSGGTADQALGNVEGLISNYEVALGGRYIEFRPDGASKSVYFELRATPEWTWKYQWAQFAGAMSSIVECKVQVAPLGLLAPMDIIDDFGVDSRGDYRFDAGTSSDVTVSAGSLVPAGTMTSERRMIHTSRGYLLSDTQDTIKATVGTTLSGFKAGIVLHCTTTNSYLEVYAQDTGSLSRLAIDQVIGGVRTNKVGSSLARLTTGQTVWVRGRVEGVVLWAEIFTSAPTPTGSAAAQIAITWDLVNFSQAELDVLAAPGYSGVSWVPQQASARLDDFEHLPFTYNLLTLPEHVPLTAIPGTAPALIDVAITQDTTGLSPPVWPLVGWSPKSPPFNMVWNGDFEEDVNGWSTAAVTGVQAAAATSIARDTTPARTKYGVANAVVVLPATSGAGVNFPIYRRFRRGVTYTAVLWASAASATTSMRLALGALSIDVANSTAAALSTTPTKYTVSWTPQFDRDVAYVSMFSGAATATTFNIDGVMVFEGTVEPTVGRHGEGAGAVPPFGIIEAESADTGDLTGWAVAADIAHVRCNNHLYDSAVAGAETYTAGWWVDPSLMVADDFSAGEIDIEFWARWKIHGNNVAPRAVLSARPEWGTAFGAERFTAEFVAAGRLLPDPSSGATWRMSRLGTITFPVDAARPARWKLWVTAATAAGSSGDFGLDYLIAVPSNRRVAGASGKPNDASYPDFIASTAETTRTITSQLQGLVAKPPFAAQPTAGAVGGPMLELPPGQSDLLIKMSSLVPDDPTSNATTESLQYAATVHVAVTPRVNLAAGS